MIFFLLSGCGSDSTPKGSAGGKKEKVSQSGSAMKTVTPMLIPKEGGTAPKLPQLEKMPEGFPSPEELEAKRAEAARAYHKLDPKAEVIPGLTKEQLEAKIEAQRAKKPDPTRAILPGLTPAQLDAKLKAYRERPTPPGPIHGLTQEQVNNKAAQERQMQEMESHRPEQMFPNK